MFRFGTPLSKLSSYGIVFARSFDKGEKEKNKGKKVNKKKELIKKEGKI